MLAQLLFLWLQCASIAAQAGCYLPDGTDRNAKADVLSGQNRYEPCTSGSGHSMCYNVNVGDKCAEDGLVFNVESSQLWRESCTDPTWQAPECLKICYGDQLNEQGERMRSGDMMIERCNDGTYCCGGHDYAQKSCCALGKGFVIANRTASISSSAALVPTASKHIVAPSSNSTPAPSTTRGPSSSSINKYAIIGGSVASVVGAIFLATIGFWFWRQHRRYKRGLTYAGIDDAHM